MTPSFAHGTPGAGTGPAPLSAAFSDRAGSETAEGVTAEPTANPMASALRMLDELSAPELDAPGRIRTVVDSGEAAPVDADSAQALTALDQAEAPAPARATGGERREQILDGASAMFAERGYHGASLRDISRRVGISHPGMLHHFSSKDILLGAVIDRLEAHAQGLLDSVETLQTSPQALLATLQGPWNPQQHQMGLFATLSAEAVNPEHPGRFRLARLRLVHEHVLEKAFEAYEERGQLRPDLDPAALARAVVSLLLSVTVRERTVRELQQKSTVDSIEDVLQFVGNCIEVDRASA